MTAKILIVDDDEGIRTFVQCVLEANGYDVLAAGGGQQAMDVIEAHNGVVDLLLTDVEMPGMSGLDLEREIELSHPEIRVIFMSGSPDLVTDQLEGRFVLCKPFLPYALLSMVKYSLCMPAR